MNDTPMISFAGLQMVPAVPTAPTAPVDESDYPRAKRKYERSAYAGDPEEALTKLALQKMAAYQIDALDAIHDLAMMPISTNSAQNQVKFVAAKLLAFREADQAPSDGGLEGTLRALNDAYHKDAPRIRSVRERVVTFESEPRVIEQQP